MSIEIVPMNLKGLKASIDATNVPELVRAEIAALLYPRSFRIGTSIFNSILYGVVLFYLMRNWLPVAWTGVALLICGSRTLDWWRYRHTPGRYTDAMWIRRFTFQFLPFGIWWGTSAAVMFLSDDPVLLAVTVLSTDAMAAGSVCSYPAHPPAALVFVIPAMVSFGVAGLIHGQLIGNFIAIVELVLIANYLIIVAEFYRSSIRGMVLHDEKSILADNLAEAHAALQREGAAKSEFLAHVSHELRTPLNAIIGFSDVINAEVFGPLNNEKYEDYLKDIQSSADHLLHIVNEILDLARIEAGELTLDMEQIDPAYIAQFTVRLVEQQALAKGLRLELRVRPELSGVTLKTDEIRLKQIMINLTSNAIKFTEPGGAVTLTVGLKEGGIFFEIADTGVGMTEAEVKRALLPFMQVGSAMQRRQGTGLGLPLSRQLAERLGGAFAIVSSPGVGTTVTVTLPLSAP